MYISRLKNKGKLLTAVGAVTIIVAAGSAFAFKQTSSTAFKNQGGQTAIMTSSRHHRPTPTPTTTPTPSPSKSPSPSPIASATPAPTTTATPAPPASSTPKLNARTGIAAGSSLPSFSATELARRLDGIKALGVGWVRYDIEWANIEQRGPGQYDWSAYDRVANAISSRGLQSLAVLDYTPPWARRGDCSATSACAPSDPNAFGNFAAVAATHYKAMGIHAWEIWNEPNSAAFFQPVADPSAYAALLKAAYTKIKQADPSATIITGGLAPADTDGQNYSPPDFLTAIYNAGAGGYFDALGHHPYTFPVTAAYPNPDNAWGQLTTMHNIMTAHNDGAKKIWPTEYGAPTGGPGPTAVTNDYSISATHISETLQSQTVTDLFNTAAGYPWLGPIMWYSYQDAGTSQTTNENFFGLLRADGSQKPAYDTFIKAVLNY